MTTLVWTVVAVLAAIWTGMAALLSQLAEWLVAALSSGQAGDVLAKAGQWPVPAWLAPWVDPGWVETAQASVLAGMEWLVGVMPAASSLLGWISPLVWVIWGVGMALLLVTGGGLHWLARHFQASEPSRIRSAAESLGGRR